MGNYSFVERHMVILYNTIEVKYVVTGGFILFVTFLVLVYLK